MLTGEGVTESPAQRLLQVKAKASPQEGLLTRPAHRLMFSFSLSLSPCLTHTHIFSGGKKEEPVLFSLCPVGTDNRFALLCPVLKMRLSLLGRTLCPGITAGPPDLTDGGISCVLGLEVKKAA